MNYNIIYQELLSDIKNSKLHYDIKKALNDIYNDKNLIVSIDRYRETLDEEIKKQIYNNEKFMRYKKLENETNMLIFKINKIFKELGDNNENS